MPATETLVNMRNRARQRADQVDSTFVPDAELNTYLNTYLAELHDLLVGAYGEDYFTTSATFTTVSGQEVYNIVTDISVSDMYKLRGVDIFVTPSHPIALRKFNFLNRNRGIGPSDRIYSTDTRYRLIQGNIHLVPAPDSGRTAKLWYVPSFTKLSLDADTFDGINGWEEYAVLKAARRMLVKEESPDGS